MGKEDKCWIAGGHSIIGMSDAICHPVHHSKANDLDCQSDRCGVRATQRCGGSTDATAQSHSTARENIVTKHTKKQISLNGSRNKPEHSGHGRPSDIISNRRSEASSASEDPSSAESSERTTSTVEEPETGSQSTIDDPVRMYLMQMGEIPMLSREEEISSARRIEQTRTCFRRTMLRSDFILNAAVELLEKVADGRLRLDRTIEISVTNTTEKRRILRRIVPNVRTIHHLMARNQIDFRLATKHRTSMMQRQRAWRRLICRRNKVVRLIEELNLRLPRLLPIMDRLHEIANRMTTIKGRGVVCEHACLFNTQELQAIRCIDTQVN